MRSIFAIRRIKGYTMQTFASVYEMEDLIREADARKIPGAVVETGCWKGGLGAYMARFGREVWIFDSFEGLPELTQEDADLAASKHLALNTKTGYISVPEACVQEISAKLGVKPRVVKGWFDATLPASKAAIGPIAILRMDGDTYGSTMQTLDALYDSVSPGGMVVIDDYFDFEGCRHAIYDFFAKRGISPAIHMYPYGRPYFCKQA